MAARRNSLIMIVVAVTLGAGFWFGVARPQRERLRELRAEVDALRRGQAPPQKESLTARRAQIQALEAELAELESRIPRSADFGPLITEVSRRAEALALREQNLEPGVPRTRGRLVVLPVHVQFVAGFEGAFGFLRELEEMHPMVRIRELRIERLEPFRGDLRAELILQAFYDAV